LISRGGTYGNPDNAGVGLDPVLVTLAPEAECRDGTGDDELDGQNGVDLADELISDIDGSLGDRAAKLSKAR
jgi:hypothetical protein